MGCRVEPGDQAGEFVGHAGWDGDVKGLGEGEEGLGVGGRRSGPGGERSGVGRPGEGVQPGEGLGVAGHPVVGRAEVVQVFQDHYA